MGRPKGRYQGLPQHMTGRCSGGKIIYYYQRHGKKKSLGNIKVEALRLWAIEELRIRVAEEPKLGSGFVEVSSAYLKHMEPLLKANTMRHYRTAVKHLKIPFEKFRLEDFEPRHVKKYLRERSKKGAAMFEKKVLSAMFNWAREEGLTSVANPCHGMKFSQSERRANGKIGKRDRYVTDAEFHAVWQRAEPVMQDVLDIAYLTGQRPSDVLKMTRQDMREGTLLVVQVKTGAKVPISITGKLKRVLERALGRPRRVQSMYIIANEKGQPWSYDVMHDRFLKALGDDGWQFRDIRAKTATDLPDIAHAQGLLGHANELTTSGYRRSKGAPISPLEPEDLERTN